MASSICLVCIWVKAVPNPPGVAPIKPAVFLLRTEDSRDLDAQSNAFFRATGIPELHSGLTMIIPSTSLIAGLNDVTVSGTPPLLSLH